MSTATSKFQSGDNTSTTHKAASMAHDAIDHAAEKAEPLEHKIREQASRAQEKIGSTQAEASEQLHQQVERVESFIKERPLAATGIAFGAGILAAIILRR